jgi:hypothetical protein
MPTRSSAREQRSPGPSNVPPLENTLTTTAIGELPLVPSNLLPHRQRMSAINNYHVGLETLGYAGGPVTGVRRALQPVFTVSTSSTAAVRGRDRRIPVTVPVATVRA